MSRKSSPVLVPWAKPYIDAMEIDCLMETVKSGWLSQGQRVRELEAYVSELTGSPYCIAVNSGTAALDIALKLFEISPGDEIIVPAFAYIASANCILYQGATPVFVDVNPRTFNIDPDDVRRKITPRTRGIIALDYAGQAAPWDDLRAIADEFRLFLIEDGAPGFGGKYKGRALCTLGDVGITSFHVAKIFTSIEGGIVFTAREDFSHTAKMIRSQGESFDEKYVHPVLGHNYRMSDVHAAIGLAQLHRYKEVLARRTMAAEFYTRHLAEIGGVQVPHVLDGSQHSWFLYPILVLARDQVREYLLEKGIETNVSWPRPIYEQPLYMKFKRGVCPVSEAVCRQVICLPMYYELTQTEQSIVVNAMVEAIERTRKKAITS